ncbi:MAG: major facilitator superfamily protein, partial [Promethearchaeota archaeon CR_4]
MKGSEHVSGVENPNLKKYAILQVLTFILFALGPIVGNVILVLQGAIGVEFHETPQEVLTAIPAFMFPFAVVQLFSGAISDIRGRIPVIFLGLLFFGAGNVIAAMATQLRMYTIANVLMGVGFGFINPVLIALITDITPGPNIPWKVSVLGGVAMLGVGIGPLLAGFFVTYGWQMIYIFFAIITFLSCVVLVIIRHPPWKSAANSGLKSLASQFSQEWRRPVVLLMMASAFLIAQGYLSIAIMTSTAVSGIISPSLWGAVLLFMGFVGAVAAVISGNYNRKKGSAPIFWVGGTCLIISIVILLSLGDSLGFQNFPLLILALLIAGIS